MILVPLSTAYCCAWLPGRPARRRQRASPIRDEVRNSVPAMRLDAACRSSNKRLSLSSADHLRPAQCGGGGTQNFCEPSSPLLDRTAAYKCEKLLQLPELSIRT